MFFCQATLIYAIKNLAFIVNDREAMSVLEFFWNDAIDVESTK